MWIGKLLLLLHVVAGGVLVGSCTHLAIQTVFLIRGRARPRLLRVYPLVALVAWAVTFLGGAVLYPKYRVEIRAAWLDAHATWASILFDVKENLAVFVGPLLAAAWWLAPTRNAARADRISVAPETARWFALVALAAASISWWNFLSGLLVGSMRSV